MVSVSKAANMLSVSPARIRALIASGSLSARKIGRTWAIDEEDVLQRLSDKPNSGRPSTRQQQTRKQNASEMNPADLQDEYASMMRALYVECKQHLSVVPSSDLIANAQTREEASFYISVADFFLKQKQYELIEQGVY